MPKTRPDLKLVGADGNALMLLGLAKRAATKSGWTPEEWTEVLTEARAGDYDHLLQTLMTHFEVH